MKSKKTNISKMKIYRQWRRGGGGYVYLAMNVKQGDRGLIHGEEGEHGEAGGFEMNAARLLVSCFKKRHSLCHYSGTDYSKPD